MAAPLGPDGMGMVEIALQFDLDVMKEDGLDTESTAMDVSLPKEISCGGRPDLTAMAFMFLVQYKLEMQ